MERISSGGTLFYKWLFSMAWFGMLAIFTGMMFPAYRSGGVPIFIFLMPVAMGVFGFYLFKKLMWPVADEVMDAGDALVVRFGRNEERVPLANIMNVSYAWMMMAIPELL